MFPTRLIWRLAALAVALVPASATAQLRLVPFDVRVPKAPIPASVGDHSILVYELRITNVGRRDLALRRLEVASAGTVLGAFEGDSLKGMVLKMGDPTADGRTVAAGRQTLVYLALAVPNGAVPARLDHRFLVSSPDSLAAAPTDTLAGYSVSVDRRPAIVIQSPLRGGPWLTGNGPGNASGHRRTAIPISGQARIAQRYAVDWVLFGSDGNLFHGDSTKNENWYGYRHPVRAVAPGTVVAVKDGIPENVALAPDRAVPITLETVGGNHVILDIGGGNYAFYAHLIPGSLKVKVGDKVTPGQVVGLLGNSGNSDAPHLHFHVGDRPAPLATEGVPYLFDQYSMLGSTPGFPEPWKGGTPSPRRRAIPLENQVIQFQP